MPNSSSRTFASGARQFVVQDALEMMWRVVVGVVHADDEGGVLVLRGGRDDDLLGSGVDVRLGLGRVREDAGGLDDDVGTELAPGKVRGVALGGGAEGHVADGDRVLVVADLLVQDAEDRVVLEQVRKRLVVREVVDADDLHVGAGLEQGAGEVTPDAAEAVDANLDGHGFSLLLGAPLMTHAQRLGSEGNAPAHVVRGVPPPGTSLASTGRPDLRRGRRRANVYQ
jgi:hypothetical protein